MQTPGESHHQIDLEISKLMTEYHAHMSQHNEIKAREVLSRAKDICPDHIKIAIIEADEAFLVHDFVAAYRLYSDIFTRDHQNLKAEARLKIVEEKLREEGIFVSDILTDKDEKEEQEEELLTENVLLADDDEDDSSEDYDDDDTTEILTAADVDDEIDEYEVEDEPKHEPLKLEREAKTVTQPQKPAEITAKPTANIDFATLSGREASFILAAAKSAKPAKTSGKEEGATSGKEKLPAEFVLPPTSPKMGTGEATKAALRSMFLPGVGQIYNDEIGKGLCICGVYIFLLFYVIVRVISLVRQNHNGEFIERGDYATTVFLGVIVIGIWIYSMVDAYNNA